VKPAPFKYVRAGTVGEAVSALAEWDGEARLLAGGQSLVPLLNVRLAQPAALVDVNPINTLAGIREDEDAVSVGALVRHSGLEWSPVVGARLPLLTEAVRHVGDRQIRTRGTIGGSLAHADPTAELAVTSLALGARITAESPRGTRVVPAAELFLGPYATSLEMDEMITEVVFPRRDRAVSAFVECSRRHGDFAVLSVAAVGVPGSNGDWSSLELSLGGVSDRPLVVHGVSALAAGSSLEPDVVAAIGAACVEASQPPSDVRASAEYRRHLIPIYVERALSLLRERRAGGAR
jgi:aerobic carbon-monoxide dehydrogenase medium subunit